MNIQRIFDAVAAEPDQHTLIVVVSELESQGYRVTVDGKYQGSAALAGADAAGEFEMQPLVRPAWLDGTTA